MHRGIYTPDKNRGQIARDMHRDAHGISFHTRDDIPASPKERSGESSRNSLDARIRALERVKLDRADSYKRANSGSPARTRQKQSFHKEVSRMRGSLVSPKQRDHHRFHNEPHHIRKKYDNLSEPTKLWLVRVVSRLLYKHMRYNHATLIHGFQTWLAITKQDRMFERLEQKYPQHMINRLLVPVKILRKRLIDYSSSMREAVVKIKVLRCWHELVGRIGHPAHRKIARRHYRKGLCRRVFRALKLHCDRRFKVIYMITQRTRYARRIQQDRWFRQWVQYTCEQRCERKILSMQRRYITKFFQRKQWKVLRWHLNCWKRWMATVKIHHSEEKHQMKILKRVIERFKHGKLSKTMNSWLEFVSLRRRYRRLAKNIFQHTLVRAFEKWMETITEMKQNRYKIQKVLVRLTKRKLAGCFDVWASTTEENKRLKLVGARVIKRMRQRMVAGLFEKWKSTIKESIRLRVVGQRVIKKMLLRKLSLIFSHWTDVIEETKRLRLIVKRIGARWLKAGLVTTFSSWRNATQEQKKLRLISKKIIQRMLQKHLIKCFCHWTEVIEETKRLRLIVKRIGARWLKAGMVTMLHKWKHYVEQIKHDRSVVGRWLNSVEHREIASALRTWKLFVADYKMIQTQNELQSIHAQYAAAAQKQQQMQMQRVVQRFRHRRLGGGLEGWKEFVSLRRRYRRLAKNIFQHTLVRAFEKWMETITEMKQNRYKIQKVLVRLTKRKLAGCFDVWASTTEENKRLKLVGARVIKRMRQRMVAGLFEKWKSTIKESIRLRVVGQRVIKKMLLRKLSLIFSHWTDVIEETKRLRLIVKRIGARWLKAGLVTTFSSWRNATQEQKKLRLISKKIIQRMLQKHLIKCFCHWTEVIEETKRLRLIVKRIGARWLKAGMVTMLHKWKHYVEQIKHDRSVVGRWLNSVEHREIASALRTWKLFVADYKMIQTQNELQSIHAQYAAAAQKQQQMQMQRVVQRFRHRRLGGGLEGWKEFVSLRRRYRHFAKRLFQHRLLAVFNTWYEWIEETKRLRLVCAKVMVRFTKRKMAGCFDVWASTMKENKRMNIVGARVIAKFRLRSVCAAFSSWHHSILENKRLRLVCAKVLARLTKRKMNGCFCHWTEVIAETKRLRLIVLRIGARWLKAGLVQTLHQWKSYAKQRCEDRLIVERWLVAVKNREVVSALRSWRIYVEHERYQEQQAQYNATVGQEQNRLLFEFHKRRRHRVMYRCTTQWRRVIVRIKLRTGRSKTSTSTQQVGLPQDVSLDTLVELISELMVKNILAEQEREQEREHQKRLVNEADLMRRRKRPGSATSPRRDGASQTRISRDSSSQTPRASPRNGNRSGRTGKSVPKNKPWISGISSSPSHSKVVHEQEEFTKSYRFREKGIRNAWEKDNQDNQDDHERHSHQKERQRHRSSHNHRQETSENLKYKVQHFLNSIKASFTEGSSFDDENDEIGSGRRKGSSGSSGRRYRR